MVKESIRLPRFEPREAPALTEALSGLAWVEKPEGSLTLEEAARLVFAAGGVVRATLFGAFRAVPSAGATYPLEIYLLANEVEELGYGLYHYVSRRPMEGELHKVGEPDIERAAEALGVEPGLLERAPLALIIGSVRGRTTAVYGDRGHRYVDLEIGHAIQNVSLEAASLGLGVRWLEADEGALRELAGHYVDAEIVMLAGKGSPAEERPEAPRMPEGERIGLPEPPSCEAGLEQALVRRRSIRAYRDEPLPLEALAFILWWSAGASRRGTRPYIPPGERYEIMVAVCARDVKGLASGVYIYDGSEHELIRLSGEDVSRRLWAAALAQDWVWAAQANLVLLSEAGDTREAAIEAGEIGQNVYLTATAIGAGTVAIGAFYDEELGGCVGLGLHPLYLFPVGLPAE